MNILDISFVQFQNGKPLWKHNNSLLNDEDYIEIINNKIDEVKKQYALPVYNMDQINNIPDDQRTSDTLIEYLPIFQMLPKFSQCIRYRWYSFEYDA